MKARRRPARLKATPRNRIGRSRLLNNDIVDGIHGTDGLIVAGASAC
ncbi:hypothetical protein [Sphingopyxis sp. Root154]|nr:hypothetical protein [Sphingopyxis sp. Root154]